MSNKFIFRSPFGLHITLNKKIGGGHQRYFNIVTVSRDFIIHFQGFVNVFHNLLFMNFDRMISEFRSEDFSSTNRLKVKKNKKE
ncbi:hypothetical protein Csa_006340 [Cucumis sativus]|uniref:Uncharacterized protein n=1 Tax=Cucumis sativus TaxID=3659 RepID=A0A0A0LIC9_CUCSA|nr:hypothetical protein Csa_006340 [Cucumis sativus]